LATTLIPIENLFAQPGEKLAVGPMRTTSLLVLHLKNSLSAIAAI
jgi:hypothetical protein